MKKQLIAVGLLLIVALCACAPKPEAAGPEGMVDAVLKRGTLRVGIATFVPWAMQAKDGQLVGFEVDVARRLAKDMGVKVEFVPTKWSGIIPALLTGKFDMIIGGMGIQPERCAKVNFSNPYDYSGMGLVASLARAGGRTSLADFDRPETVIVARIGTTAADAAAKFMPRAKLRLFDDEAQAVQELLNGRADALVASSPLPAFQALSHPDKLYLPVAGTFTREPIGFAVRKGDADTVNYLNSWITVVEAEGFLAERKHYWFETRDWAGLVE